MDGKHEIHKVNDNALTSSFILTPLQLGYGKKSKINSSQPLDYPSELGKVHNDTCHVCSDSRLMNHNNDSYKTLIHHSTELTNLKQSGNDKNHVDQVNNDELISAHESTA